MPQTGRAGLENSIANTLGMLYEKKARGTVLIRVLEDYRRCLAAPKRSHRSSRFLISDMSATPEQELERLRLRRAAVDQLIRSIEAYSSAQPSAASRH